jgi:hypothetical protein
VIQARQAELFTVAATIHTPLDPGTELCCLRAAQQTPETEGRLLGLPHRRKRCGLLRSCAMSNAMALVVQDVPTRGPLRINPEVCRLSMHAKLLAGVAHDRVIMMVHLLTLLGARAPHAHRTSRRRLRRRKPWHVHSCSLIFLLLPKRWRSGELPSRASSASPTKMGRKRPGPRDRGPSIRREPMSRRPEVVQPQCTPLRDTSGS